MDDYFAECDEHLATMRRLLLSLDESRRAQPIAPSMLEELFRSFHSIKGISGMVELREAEMLAHHMESYLRALRQREAHAHAGRRRRAGRGVDALERAIVARRENRAAPPISGAIAEIAAVMPGRDRRAAARGRCRRARPRQQPHGGWRRDLRAVGGAVARGVNVDTVRARLRDAGTIVDAAPQVLPSGIAFEFLFSGDSMTRPWRPGPDGITVTRGATTTAAVRRARRSAGPRRRRCAGGGALADAGGRLALSCGSISPGSTS